MFHCMDRKLSEVDKCLTFLPNWSAVQLFSIIYTLEILFVSLFSIAPLIGCSYPGDIMNAKMQVEANQENGPWSENKVLAYHCERQEEVGGGVKICRKNAQGQYYWEDNTKPCVLRDYPGGSIFCVITYSVLNSPSFAWHPYGKLELFKTELVLAAFYYYLPQLVRCLGT